MGKVRKIGKEFDEKHILSEGDIAAIIKYAHRHRRRLYLHANAPLTKKWIY